MTEFVEMSAGEKMISDDIGGVRPVSERTYGEAAKDAIAEGELHEELAKDMARKRLKMEMRALIKEVKFAHRKLMAKADVFKNGAYLRGFSKLYEGVNLIQHQIDWGLENKDDD